MTNIFSLFLLLGLFFFLLCSWVLQSQRTIVVAFVYHESTIVVLYSYCLVCLFGSYCLFVCLFLSGSCFNVFCFFFCCSSYTKCIDGPFFCFFTTKVHVLLFIYIFCLLLYYHQYTSTSTSFYPYICNTPPTIVCTQPHKLI